MQLIGCAASTPTPLVNVLTGLYSDQFSNGGELVLAAKLNPIYRYLRVEVVGRPAALLVLGYVDPHPQGDIEVWYSAKREVIKTQNGRIVGATGLELDWRRVWFPVAPPAWVDVPQQGSTYQRLRDQMPGYHDSVSDQLEIKPWIDTPPVNLPANQSLVVESAYQWFREQSLSTTGQPLPPAWFALGRRGGQRVVVYSEQCLSASYCLKLQRWPFLESAP